MISLAHELFMSEHYPVTLKFSRFLTTNNLYSVLDIIHNKPLSNDRVVD